MTDRIELQTNGVMIKGFDEVILNNQIDTLCSTFELTAVANINSNLKEARYKVLKGQSCQIYKDNKLFLTGYIKDVCPFYLDGKKALKIIGRSKAGDVVDSSVFGEVFKSLNAPQIISSLLTPFSISLKTDLKGLKRHSSFAISTAEKLENVLKRLCKMNNTLLYSDETGNLFLTKRGNAKPTNFVFKTGKDGFLTKGSVIDEENDYSKVTLIGQTSLEDEFELNKASSDVVSIEFSNNRHKTKVIFAEEISEVALEKEIKLLNKKSKSISLTVANWVDLTLNAFETVQDDWLGLNGKYLIAGVAYKYSKKTGHQTDVLLEDCYA